MKNYVITILLAIFFTPANSQIDSSFQELLTAVFKNNELSRHILDSNYIKNGAVFIYENNTFDYHATSFATKEIKLPNLNRGVSNIFNVDGLKVFVFIGMIELFGYTDNKVRTVVVLENIRYKKNLATISFHTTSVYSSGWYKRNRERMGLTQKFVKINCSLKHTGSDWLVDKITVKEIPFKSLLDKE